MNCVAELLDRWIATGARRAALPDLADRDPHLRATGRAREPHRQCAHARSRPRAGQSRAAARAQQPDDGRGLSRGHQGRRRRGRDHAAAARQGDRLSDREGEDRARALRRPARRRDGKGAAARRRSQAHRLLGQRRARRARSADGEARLRDLHRLRHRERRRVPDRLHLGHHRRAEGHHAFPPRHAGDLRQLRPSRAARASRTTASSARRRSPSPSGSAGLCCFRCASAPRRSCWKRPRPTNCSPPSRSIGATICFTAPTAYRAMLGKLAEHDISSLRKCVSAGEALPKATFDAWHEATGIRILDGIGATEMLHIFIGSPEDEIRAGRDRQAGAGLRGARGRRRRQRGAARHHRPPRGARSDRLPLSRRRAPDANTCRTAGTSPATPISWMTTAISGTRRAPTT